jgi:hypothetical protein
MTIAIASGTPSLEKPTLLTENLFEQGTVTSAFANPGFPSANALTDETFDFWVANVSPNAITVDMGVATPASAVGIAAHTLGTSGTQVLVRSSADNSIYVTRLTINPADNSTIFGVFPEVSARYWRVVFQNAPITLGVLKLGKRVIVPSGVALGHVSVNHGQRIELLSNDSMNGQFLGTRIERRSGDISLDMGLVPRDFIEGDFADFETRYNEGRSFFYCGSPLNLPLDTGYCKRPMGGGEVRPSHVGGDLMQLQFGAQVYVG